MIKAILKKTIGTKNEREIKKILKEVEKVNVLESKFEKFTDEELKSKTVEFQEKIKKGSTLDEIRVEAFAVVREVSKRVIGMRHYDVQLVGGAVLQRGEIAEMKTGEGKTLVATLPVYLNALSGKGAHVVTVNDYLATRDKEWMGKVYRFLGLTVGVIVNGMDNEERKEAYNCDIVYGTNNEFGFDYLRDNMVQDKEQKVQRELNYALVDEVDSILIDEARTPLIISGPSEETTKWYKVFSEMSLRIGRDKDYEVDEKAHSIVLTEEGIKRVEKELVIDNLYSPENVELTHYLIQALRAKELFSRDKDYIVKDEEVIIVDEFTGRLMPGRRYSEGLHQAIEAKERVEIAGENQTLASITLQNYFRMYKKLSGMTGTAETEASEFMHIYKLPVVSIPTNRPIKRDDKQDLIFKTQREKTDAVIKKIMELYKTGQPILVGTASIDSSEQLASILKVKKIPHEVLNAKYHGKEAEIVSQAGRFRSITIATNMAGRGTDIVLGGNPEMMAKNEVPEEDERYTEIFEKYIEQCKKEKEKVINAGGLYILGTERNESRRIDNQLRGRAGRQGDPGTSEFYLSLEDNLMRLFGSERVGAIMSRLGLEDGEAIQHSMINKSIENAQKKVEGRNFSVRKQLLEYDDVMNKQREIIYKQRNEVLDNTDLQKEILGMLKSTIKTEIKTKLSGETRDDWNTKGVKERLSELFEHEVSEEKLKSKTVEENISQVFTELEKKYKQKEEEYSPEIMRRLERYILLEIVDSRWRENLSTLDSLKEGIHLRAYGQKDPVIEYKMLSSEIYAEMIGTIKEEVVSYLFKIRIRTPEVNLRQKPKETRMFYNDGGEEIKPKQRKVVKVGRNDLCPCGSGKKYKKCCGR